MRTYIPDDRGTLCWIYESVSRVETSGRVLACLHLLTGTAATRLKAIEIKTATDGFMLIAREMKIGERSSNLGFRVKVIEKRPK